MFGIGMTELMVIGAAGLLVLGPRRLPEAVRYLGALYGEIAQLARSGIAAAAPPPDEAGEVSLEDWMGPDEPSPRFDPSQYAPEELLTPTRERRERH